MAGKLVYNAILVLYFFPPLYLKNLLDGYARVKETADADGASWHAHMLRRGDDSVLRVAPDLKANGKRTRGRPKTNRKNWNSRGGKLV